LTHTWPGPPPAAGVAAGVDLDDDIDDVLDLLDAAAAVEAAGVLLLVLPVLLVPDVEPELEPEEPLADLFTPLCPRQAPLVVVTVAVVPSLHVTVMLPAAGVAGAADWAWTPVAAISAAAITAINPNDFILIPSDMKAPDAESAVLEERYSRYAVSA
jgi:hypothetical protein